MPVGVYRLEVASRRYGVSFRFSKNMHRWNGDERRTRFAGGGVSIGGRIVALKRFLDTHVSFNQLAHPVPVILVLDQK